VEEYGERQEQEVEADEQGDGWLTADPAAAGRGAPGATTTNADGFEEVPCIDEEPGGSGGVADAAAASDSAAAAADDEDVPDIADLDLEEEEEDVVGGRGWAGTRQTGASSPHTLQDGVGA
jgi:hypothetical protein